MSKKIMKGIDNPNKSDIIIIAVSVISNAELCNGSTADSDSVCLGSNPSSAAINLDCESSRDFFFPILKVKYYRVIFHKIYT